MRAGKTINYKIIIFLLSLLIVTFLLTCNRVAQKTLVETLLASCGDYQVFLSGWWNKAGDQQPNKDPMGGYIFLYWVDEDGNACYGEPGVSGQPGSVFIKSFFPEAYNTAYNGNAITPEQLEDYQEIHFNLEGYSASGFHFVQYANTIWRDRVSGETYMVKATPVFSIPDAVSLDYEFCLVPVYDVENSDCASTQVIPLPNTPASSQHPDMCQERALPYEISMSEEELLENCIIILPHGLEFTEPQ